MKHTPAPWKISHENHAYVILSKRFVVADVFHEEKEGKTTGAQSTEEAKANALLIAAAPDLLSALEKAVNHKNAFWNNSDALDAALFAIRKAKGTAE
jgi:hypothetical protein